MKLRDMIITRMQEQGYTDISIEKEYRSMGYGDSVYYPMKFTDPKNIQRTSRAYPNLDMGPGEEYSIHVENVDDEEDETWEADDDRVYMTL